MGKNQRAEVVVDQEAVPEEEAMVSYKIFKLTAKTALRNSFKAFVIKNSTKKKAGPTFQQDVETAEEQKKRE